MMECKDGQLRFADTLWVRYGGVDVSREKGHIMVEGRDDDSYLKVLNHFGRVLKLYIFEEGGWIDSATGAAPVDFDPSLGGRVTPPSPAKQGKTAGAAAPAKKRAKAPAAKAKSTATSRSKSTTVKPPAAKAKAARTTVTKPPAAKAGKSTAKPKAGAPAGKAGSKRAAGKTSKSRRGSSAGK